MEHKKKQPLKTTGDQCFVQTICDSIDLINETLVSELCGQRCEKVDIAVEEEQRVKYRQDLILGASKLSLHPHHHVGYMLKTKKMQSSDKYFKTLARVHSCVCKCSNSPVHILLCHKSVEWCHRVPVNWWVLLLCDKGLFGHFLSSTPANTKRNQSHIMAVEILGTLKNKKRVWF